MADIVMAVGYAWVANRSLALYSYGRYRARICLGSQPIRRPSALLTGMWLRGRRGGRESKMARGTALWRSALGLAVWACLEVHECLVKFV